MNPSFFQGFAFILFPAHVDVIENMGGDRPGAENGEQIENIPAVTRNGAVAEWRLEKSFIVLLEFNHLYRILAAQIPKLQESFVSSVAMRHVNH